MRSTLDLNYTISWQAMVNTKAKICCSEILSSQYHNGLVKSHYLGLGNLSSNQIRAMPTLNLWLDSELIHWYICKYCLESQIYCHILKKSIIVDFAAERLEGFNLVDYCTTTELNIYLHVMDLPRKVTNIVKCALCHLDNKSQNNMIKFQTTITQYSRMTWLQSLRVVSLHNDAWVFPFLCRLNIYTC